MHIPADYAAGIEDFPIQIQADRLLQEAVRRRKITVLQIDAYLIHHRQLILRRHIAAGNIEGLAVPVVLIEVPSAVLILTAGHTGISGRISLIRGIEQRRHGIHGHAIIARSLHSLVVPEARDIRKSA